MYTLLYNNNNDLAKKQNTITGAASSIISSNLTTSRVLISNSSGKVAVSSITNTELGYLDNTTSNIQNQINAVTDSLSWKLAGSATGTGNITIALSTCKELLVVSTATSPHNMTIHTPPVAGYYCGSFYVTNTDTSFFRIRVQSTNVHLVVAYSCTSEGTTDVTNSASISVYYR